MRARKPLQGAGRGDFSEEVMARTLRSQARGELRGPRGEQVQRLGGSLDPPFSETEGQTEATARHGSGSRYLMLGGRRGEAGESSGYRTGL